MPTFARSKSSSLNTPTIHDSDASSVWLEVTDPAEPLYGKRFEVLKVSRGPEAVAEVLVRYQDDIQLRLPLRATDLVTTGLAISSHELPRVKLSRSSVEELFSLVKEYELCRHLPKKSGQRSASRTSKKSRKN